MKSALPQGQRRALSEPELRALLDALPENTAASHIIRICAGTGILIRFLLRLRLRDFDPAAAILTIPPSAKKPARSYVLPKTMHLPQDDGHAAPGDFIFRMPREGLVRARDIQAALGRAAKSAGIYRRVHPADLCDTFAVLSLKQGTDPGLIARHMRMSPRAFNTRYGKLPADQIRLASPLDSLEHGS